jgi:hypothetical protein
LHKLEKKLIVIFMSLTFLTSGIITASAITIQENKVGEQKETTPLTKTVILYRHGIDGSVTPFEVNLNLEDGQDIGKVMADKCEELLENDEEIQKFLALSDYKLGFLSKVKSHGRGTHYQTVILGKLVARFILFRLGLPRLHTLLTKPLVYCRYKEKRTENDEPANTTITPLLFKNISKPRYMEGKHQVIVYNLLGYTTWLRRFSFSPFDVLPRSFAGYATLVICRKLK